MKVSDFGTGPKFACKFTSCKVTGPPDKMWNVKNTSTILCGEHSHEARTRGLKTFRLSATLDFLREKEEKADHFFASFQEVAHGPRERGKKPR